MIEYRTSNEGLTVAERVITVLAVPYDQEAVIEYRGEVWRESFQPGAFNPLPDVPDRVRVNREHNRMHAVGKSIAFRDSAEGLISELRIAETALGDDTLALAREGMLSSSIGFLVPGSGERLDRKVMTRRVLRAALDHIALVQSPAYAGADVLAVREMGQPDNRPPINTPIIDSILSDPLIQRVNDRYTR